MSSPIQILSELLEIKSEEKGDKKQKSGFLTRDYLEKEYLREKSQKSGFFNIGKLQIKTLKLDDMYFFDKTLKRIGTGSYGQVFKVIKKGNGKNYALKMIPIDYKPISSFDVDVYGEEALHSFEENIKTAIVELLILQEFQKNCDKLKIVCITNFYHTFYNKQDNICIEMELLSSPDNISTLEDKIDSFFECIETLDIIHATILHRDIKPDNLLYDFTTRRLKFSDFGVACLKYTNCYPKGYPDSSEIQDAIKRGIPLKYAGSRDYMDPVIRETTNFLGPRVSDVSGDLYSFGVTFFEILLDRKFIRPANTEMPVVFNRANNFYHSWKENINLLDSFYRNVTPNSDYNKKFEIMIQYLKLMTFPVSKDIRPKLQDILEDYKRNNIDGSVLNTIRDISINDNIGFENYLTEEVKREKSSDQIARDIINYIKPKSKKEFYDKVVNFSEFVDKMTRDKRIEKNIEELLEDEEFGLYDFKNQKFIDE